MIYVKNRLIIGLAIKIVKTVLKTVYKFLSFFNLHITMLLVSIGAILYFTGVFNYSRVILLVFYVLLIISILHAIIASIKKLLGLDKKVNKKGNVQIMDSDSAESTVSVSAGKIKQSNAYEIDENTPLRYFAVKDNPAIVVCEYMNRYVLYYKTTDGFKYIRTDMKG